MIGNANNYKNPVRGESIITNAGYARDEPVPITQSSDVNAWFLLDQLDVSLQELKEHIDIMNNMLSGVLRPDYDSGPVPGPRASSSNLTSRIATQADFVDDLTRTICNIRDRLSV